VNNFNKDRGSNYPTLKNRSLLRIGTLCLWQDIILSFALITVSGHRYQLLTNLIIDILDNHPVVDLDRVQMPTRVGTGE
jgi:hypothetical protein